MFSLTHPTELELIGLVPGYVALAVKGILAVILGGIIGLDREKKLKPAGVKTQILICVGACLYTMIGLSNVVAGVANYDPSRIPAQIVSGIGFLGAGAIIQSQGRITGMTTAATIWIVAAIGAAVGSGQIVTAAAFTLIIWFTLNFVMHFLNFIRPERRYFIQILGQREMEAEVLKYLSRIEHDEFVHDLFIHENENREQINLKIDLSRSELKRLTQVILRIPGVDSVNSRVIS